MPDFWMGVLALAFAEFVVLVLLLAYASGNDEDVR